MFSTIEEALKDIKSGKMIVVVDDENRENEGDLVIPASCVTSEHINFMTKYGRGLICMPMEEKRLKELKINQMVLNNTDAKETAFTVSVDYISSTTGISAKERAKTIEMLVDKNSKPEDFTKPGHIFPLKAKDKGVLQREGHTEAAVDLARLAGFYPAGVICEIMNDDGSMARVPDLIEFCKVHKLKLITIKDLIDYKKENESHVIKISESFMPTEFGNFKITGYLDEITKKEHLALHMGDITTDKPVLSRMHSECLTGDVFGSKRCDCGEQFKEAMKEIARKKRGVLLYLRQEGRGIGILNKIKAYDLQDNGYDTVEANLKLGFPDDMRDYYIGAQIYKDLKVKKLELMTNNPEKVKGLEKYGMNVESRVPIQLIHNDENIKYLKTKKEKMGHILDL